MFPKYYYAARRFNRNQYRWYFEVQTESGDRIDGYCDSENAVERELIKACLKLGITERPIIFTDPHGNGTVRRHAKMTTGENDSQAIPGAQPGLFEQLKRGTKTMNIIVGAIAGTYDYGACGIVPRIELPIDKPALKNNGYACFCGMPIVSIPGLASLLENGQGHVMVFFRDGHRFGTFASSNLGNDRYHFS